MEQTNQRIHITPQARLLCALAIVVGVVVSMPHTLFEVIAILIVIIALAIASQVSIRRMLLRSLIVIPIAGVMAVLVPLRYVTQWTWAGVGAAYAGAWPHVADLIATPWLCELTMTLLVALCPKGELLYALEKLHVPRVFVMLLTFIYRYLDVMRAQLTAAHRSLVCRAPALGRRRRVVLYGNLAGSMIVRAYDKGDRVHSAMLARGFTGLLPYGQLERAGLNDAIAVVVAALFAVALVFV
ncbi:MAG: energy-coupling factor transporter transmembrane protein EcfT [Coriobacteriales bacterium]|jgi:cobalt/nickel transport system permease protein|nr:energy-coupling factor transporter transmembrane protein EcfT [Coriobacteriales bacterium]